MEMNHFEMKISKFSNWVIVDMHVEGAKKSCFIMVTRINDGQMN